MKELSVLVFQNQKENDKEKMLVMEEIETNTKVRGIELL